MRGRFSRKGAKDRKGAVRVDPPMYGQRCGGKVSYLRRKDAKRAVRQMRAKGVENWKSLREYKCCVCGWFHLGNTLGWDRHGARVQWARTVEARSGS